MNNNFTKKDLKPGYLVEYRGGDRRLIMQMDDKKLFLTGANGFTTLSTLHDDLCYFANQSESPVDIVKVWGLPKNVVMISNLLYTKDRDLLWERKKMTLDEIEEALGYEIELVSPAEDANPKYPMRACIACSGCDGCQVCKDMGIYDESCCAHKEDCPKKGERK